MDRIDRVIARARAAMMPPRRIDLGEWIEGEIVLPHGVSALSGRVRLWPYQRGIASAIGDPMIERVTVVKSARIGYTTLLTGAIGSYVVNDPSPILVVLPTESDCRDYMVMDIEPVFSASPKLARSLGNDVEEGERNTILSRRFPGGSLKIVAAKSPRNLRRHTTRVLIVDEADAMEVTPEGPPIDLALKRTETFPDRKIIIGSTPTFTTTSNVLRAYAESDQRIYEVPCPKCGVYSEILWDAIQWPEGKPHEAGWRCPSCQSLIPERFKGQMVTDGRWRATRPEVEGHAGFRINALVSLHEKAKWGRLASEFVVARNDPERLKVFVNTVLGQGWNEGGEEIDPATLAAQVEPWGLSTFVPDDVLLLTAGVDVQHDRLEMTTCGWSEAGEVFVLGHDVIYGQWNDDETWEDLDELIARTFRHESGGRIGIEAIAVDTADGTTMERALSFCRGRRRVMPIRGVAGTRPIIERSQTRTRRRSELWLVGVDTVKAQMFAQLGKMRFSEELPIHWFEQFASERLVVRYSRGQPQRRFERLPGRRAEALDCVVYARAARAAVSVDWGARRDAIVNRGGVEERNVVKSADVAPSTWLGPSRGNWL